MPGGIAYNTNSMQTTNIITSKIIHHSAPAKKISMAPVAYGNKSIITNSNSTDKDITVSGILDAKGSIVNMDTLEDTFKTFLVGEDGNLDIEHASGTRRYIATPEVVNVVRDEGLAWAEFTVRFACAQPYGVDVSATSIASITGHTTPTRLIPMALVGSAEYQFPILELTLVSGTQLTNGTISIGNNSNGQVANITRNWAASDVLRIDPFNQMVTVNNVEVFFTGAIPMFKTGSQNMTYSDNFLTRSVNFLVTEFGRWQ